jgi:hypothetical protein
MLMKASISVIALAVGGFLAVTMIGEPERTLEERFRFEIAAARQRETPANGEQQTAGGGYEHYVSVEGSRNGTGTVASPWDLVTALAQPGSVKPGDTIWLRGGTYSGRFHSILTGTQAAPIIVRNYPGEPVRLDGCVPESSPNPVLTIDGAATWFWGFEITDCLPARQSQQAGSWPQDLSFGPAVRINAPDSKVINLVVHDASEGIDNWAPARRAEVHGSIIFANGWNGPDRGHGHGINVQNDLGSKRIFGNILFSNFRHGIHAYAAESPIDNLDIENNISFMNGSLPTRTGVSRNFLIGGLKVARNASLIRNAAYYPIDAQGAGGDGENNLGYEAGCQGAKLLSNYLAGPMSLRLANCSEVKMKDNVFVGAISGFDPTASRDNYHVTSAVANAVMVIPNAWEVGRAHIAVFNWKHDSVVEVDISRIGLKVGDKFRLQNVADYFNDTIDVVYEGKPVRIPMTDRSVAPIVGLGEKPQSTFPEFGVFLLTQY